MICPDCQKDVPNNVTVCPRWRCGYQFVLQNFAEDTQPFHLLYEEVTRKLNEYLDNPLNEDALSTLEKEWLRYLIHSFRDNYKAWEKGGPRLIRYLNRFRTLFSSPYAFRLIGHAYLHIAYDLPRIVADSLSNDGYSASGKDPLGRDLPIAIDRVRARGIFQKQSPLFLELAEKAFRRYGIAGIPGVISKLIPERLSLFRVFGNWVVGLRMSAWVHGEVLRDVNTTERQIRESRLLYAVDQAAADVVGRKYNPFWWPSRLQSPDILLAIVVVQGGVFGDIPVWSRYLTLGFLLLLLIGYLLFRYFALVQFADNLGEAIYRRTVEAMNVNIEQKQ